MELGNLYDLDHVVVVLENTTTTTTAAPVVVVLERARNDSILWKHPPHLASPGEGTPL